MSTTDIVISTHVEPLNSNTKRLFSSFGAMPNDRLHVTLDDEGKNFILWLYAVLRNPTYPGQQLNLFEREKITYPSWNTRKFLERIPERKQLVNHRDCKKKWRVAGTDFTALLINALWDKAQVSFTKEAKLLYDFLLTRFAKQTVNAKVKADYKINGKVPDMPSDFIDHPIRPLKPFQKVALYTQINEDGNLWMEQGTGKTPIVIARICLEAGRMYEKESRMYRALLVVPKNMRTNWLNKFVDFATQPGKITVLRGGLLTRVKLMVEAFKQDEECKYTVVICSYDAVIRSWSALQMIQWDYCSLDEAHMIKSSKTKRWKKMKVLRELCNKHSGLTGTPVANHLFDAYTQLEWLGEGMSGFTSYEAFKRYYGAFKKDEDSNHEILCGYKNLPILQERFARLCFMITLTEALPELPREYYEIEEIEMTRTQHNYYVKLQKQLAIEIENELNKDEKKQLTATHILTKLLRLSQITSGYVKWDAQYNEYGEITNADARFEELVPNPKIDAIVKKIKAKSKKEKTIVWTNWVPVIKMLDRRLTKEGIKHVIYYGATKDDDRQKAQDSYNQDPDIRVFIGNPAAGGQGLDLWGHIPEWDDTPKDHGCNTTEMIYFSQNWSMIHRSQSEKRATRQGTRVRVKVTDLIVPGTIDEEILVRVTDKRVTANELQDVKKIMEKILSTVPTMDDENE